jgi:hypothetical protein
MKKPICRWLAGAAALVAVLLLAQPVRSPAATPDQNKLPAGAKVGNYVGEDVMIPMRDGVKLHAEVWRPEGLPPESGPPLEIFPFSSLGVSYGALSVGDCCGCGDGWGVG